MFLVQNNHEVHVVLGEGVFFSGADFLLFICLMIEIYQRFFTEIIIYLAKKSAFHVIPLVFIDNDHAKWLKMCLF